MLYWRQDARHCHLPGTDPNTGEYDEGDCKQVTNRIYAIYFGLLNVCFIPFMSIMVRFPAQRLIFNREKAQGYYCTLPFVV